MKNLITCLLMCGTILAGSKAWAQGLNVHEAAVSFGKASPGAVIAEYDAPASVVEDALKQHMEQAGFRKKSGKGFIAYKGIAWKEVSAEKADVYFKIDGKGNKSTITVLYSKGYDNFISGSTDSETVNAIKNFLTSFTGDLKKYQLTLNIAQQEDVVKKAEKAYNETVSDGKSLADDKARIERKMADNTYMQSDRQKALDEEKRKLDDLKAMLGQ